MFDYIFGSETIKLLMAIVTLIVIGVSLIEFAGPLGIILALVSPILIDIIMNNLVVPAMAGTHWLIDSIINGADQIFASTYDFLVSENVQLSATIISVFSAYSALFFGQINLCLDLTDEDLIPKDKKETVKGFICSCLGLLTFWIDISDDQQDNDLLDLFGLSMSGFGLYYGINGAKRSTIGKICIAFSGTSIITSIIDVME